MESGVFKEEGRRGEGGGRQKRRREGVFSKGWIVYEGSSHPSVKENEY